MIILATDFVTDDYPHLDTARLSLRAFKPDDLAYLQSFALRPAFWRYLPGPEPVAELIEAYLEARLQAQAMTDTADWHFAIEARDTGLLIGTARLSIQSREHANASLAVSLDSDHWRQGFAKEALAALVDFGFDTLGLHRLSALIDAENKAGIALAEAGGFTREGILKENLRLRGQWRDSAVYARLSAG